MFTEVARLLDAIGDISAGTLVAIAESGAIEQYCGALDRFPTSPKLIAAVNKCMGDLLGGRGQDRGEPSFGGPKQPCVMIQKENTRR